MFPYIGIMADEEPKDSISPSGLYNTSDLIAVNPFDLSSHSLGGLGEYTFMIWVYLDPVDDNDFFHQVYREGLNPSIRLFSFNEQSISCKADNSNGGETQVQIPQRVKLREWVLYCVTGSVSNSIMKIYENGVLLGSSTMTYSNENMSTATIERGLSSELNVLSISQMNIFNRELSESEVAEHYVYDDDLLFAGVLGYDAMTASQRDGLVYSSSYTDTISIAGNEFTDKSGNGVTLSPQPTLTGQQIYVYTDANDLPSSATIFNVNSFNPDGSTQSARKTGYNMTGKFTNFSWSCWVKLQDTGSGQSIFRAVSITGGNADIALMYDWVALDPSLADTIAIGWNSGVSWEYVSTSDFTTNTWIHIVVAKGGSNWDLYINGNKKISHTATSTANELGNAFLATEHISLVEKLASPCSQYYMASQQLDQTDVDSLYGNGTPPCLEDLATVTKNKMTNHWKLGTFNGSTEADAMLDQIGLDDLTNIGSTPFTGTGLSVECGGTPTAPSNALPSNLPTIL